MDKLPDNRIDAIPVKPEHLKSEAIKHPAPYPEAHKIAIDKDKWDSLVEKYGEEKVKQYYKLVYTAAVAIKPKPPVIGNG